MCRIAASIGPSRPLSALLSDPPHSLEHQAYRPAEMLSGHVNVDGTGVVWWTRRGDATPLRYVTEHAPWSDPNLPSLAPNLRAEAAVAAVRSATPGMPFSAAAVGPFLADGIAFAHNGYVAKFEGAVARRALALLPDDLHAELQVRTDSLVLFALVRRRLRESPEAGLAAALAAGTDDLARLCREAGTAANLVSVASDGTRLVALRRAVGLAPNSLYSWRDEEANQALVASEPLDGEDSPRGAHSGRGMGWEPIEADTLVEAIVPDGEGRRLDWRTAPAPSHE